MMQKYDNHLKSTEIVVTERKSVWICYKPDSFIHPTTIYNMKLTKLTKQSKITKNVEEGQARNTLEIQEQ